MGKGDKQRGNREAKKPKQDKAKAPVVLAGAGADRPTPTLGARKPPRG